MEELSVKLLGGVFPIQKGIRLLGVTLSSIDEHECTYERQLDLEI
jgi:hypothetical protein